ncbi:hypothetical protein Bealeia1_01700 [Candidatus Bealeia paramacronuclearis]|uniref:Proteophosphoglycan ppg4 n=1 Tax=Candidatus Bealeia paramacronuclearis TaxID=1921001 RepID=A0ABZ2C540_9PROT|nr:hypothetical protein [Candidatus Bealeia paramacronuclearis]
MSKVLLSTTMLVALLAIGIETAKADDSAPAPTGNATGITTPSTNSTSAATGSSTDSSTGTSTPSNVVGDAKDSTHANDQEKSPASGTPSAQSTQASETPDTVAK